MENQLLIQRYQPQLFSDFGKNHAVTEMLSSLILMDDLNILLIGSMASGKTTILNALVREYYQTDTQNQSEKHEKNNENMSEKNQSDKNQCDKNQYDENILHINSLKEQGINYYRSDVKTFCQTTSCIRGKKKIVVIDDIDTINEQSQQVFRNYIDKYSNNVHFIASCTNSQKVIESIQSRLTIISIPPLRTETITDIIQRIKEKEEIEIDEEAQHFMISISNNVVKVIINYMEKFKLVNEPITYDLAVKLCSNISFIVFENYTRCLLQQELIQAIEILNEVYNKGYSIIDILDNYFMFVKFTSILTEDQKYCIIPYLCKYITIFHNIHEDEIELALFTNNLLNALKIQKWR